MVSTIIITSAIGRFQAIRISVMVICTIIVIILIIP